MLCMTHKTSAARKADTKPAPPKDPGPLARNVRAARHAADLGQERLAAKAGVSVGTVSKIERGVSQQPDLATLEAIAGALGVNVHDLLPSPAAGVSGATTEPYEAFLVFLGKEGKAHHITAAEAAMLRAVRLPPDEEPTSTMYLMWLLAYRQAVQPHYLGVPV